MAALITRCPACGTMFKVVPDQLRVSEGWVRCGHCAEVFDASAHLQDADALAAAQSPPAAAAPPSHVDHRESASNDSELPSLPPSELPSSSFPSDTPSDFAGEGSSVSSHLADDLPEQEPDPNELAAAAQTLREDPLDQPFELRRQDLSRPAELLSLPPSLLAEESAPAPLEEPGFIRQARRQARWQHPAVRALLSVLVLALLALLALQVAVQQRDRLAASEPALRPWIARLCGEIGCRIAPPRLIDAIAIDSSSFNKLRPDAYRLQVTLKNQGRIDVAMPSLELTLTDSEEQPVVRRVLAPAELGATRPSLAPATEWSGSIAIGVADNALASRISGYRLLAFYP
jgi:predicted Zn finger-like uncharacterized protein